MKKWTRRFRAALGIGAVWGIAWFAAGMVLLLIIGPGAADVPFPLGFGLLGFLAGALFSLVLGVVEAGRSFHQLSIPRFAGWGGAAGLLFSLLFVPATGLDGGALLFLGPLFAAAGAASAGGTLRLARRADDRELRGTASVAEASQLRE